MSKIEVFKKRFAQDVKVLSLIVAIEAAMAPLAEAVINCVRLPQIQKFRLSEAELVAFTEKLSGIEHEAHMALLRPVRALDEHLGYNFETGCVVDAEHDVLREDFRGAVKDWALRMKGINIEALS